MKSLWLSGLAFLVLVSPGFAHFVYILPDAAGQMIQVVFSDALAPDEKVSVDKIRDTRLFLLDAQGKQTSLQLKRTPHALKGTLPGGIPCVVHGVTEYGWVQSKHTGNEPTLLKYYPKVVVGDFRSLPQIPPAEGIALDIQPVLINGKLRFRATRNGHPLADAACALIVPGEEKSPFLKTDADGFIPGEFDQAGRYAVRVKAVDAVAGEWQEKKYDKINHWATLVLDLDSNVLQ
jgi:hypothetical protein